MMTVRAQQTTLMVTAPSRERVLFHRRRCHAGYASGISCVFERFDARHELVIPDLRLKADRQTDGNLPCYQEEKQDVSHDVTRGAAIYVIDDSGHARPNRFRGGLRRLLRA